MAPAVAPPRVAAAQQGPPPAPPLCSIALASEQAKPPGERTYPPGYWFALLVGGYRDSGDYTRPPRDCRDVVTRLEHDGCTRDAQPEVLPGRLLTVSDVVVAKLDDTKRLVWAMTDQLSDGEAQGPVAVAELLPRGIAVRALGILRGYPRNVSLRMERLGGNSILVADGEYCAAGQSGEECARAVRLLPLVGDRFLSKSLIDTDGACMGPAFISVRGGGRLAKDKDGRLQYRIETLVTFSPKSIVLREQLAIDPGTRRGEPNRASYVTRLQVDREVVVRSGNLVVDGPSLLAKWLAQHDKNAVAAEPR